jgi:hypothetical protein
VLEAVAGETAREEGADGDGDRDRDPPPAALLATTLLGSAAAAGPPSAAARVLPALSRLAAGPESVAARAAAALVRVGDAHAEDGALDESGSESDPSATKEDVAKEALRLLDDALKRRNVFVAAAFCSAVRDAAASRRRDKREGSFSYGGERPFSFSSGVSRSRRDAFWDGVASRVAAVTVAAFGDDESSIDVFAKTNDVATRRRLASLCFGAARGILEAEDDEARNATASDVPKNAKSAGTRRDALVPALRALVSASIRLIHVRELILSFSTRRTARSRRRCSAMRTGVWWRRRRRRRWKRANAARAE